MNASQRSCAELFECSCPELEALTSLARASGAYGSRLTGAGWGGCTVSLVPEEKVDEFIQKVKEGYTPYHNLEGEALHEVIFATKPSSGACGESNCVVMGRYGTDTFYAQCTRSRSKGSRFKRT